MKTVYMVIGTKLNINGARVDADVCTVICATADVAVPYSNQMIERGFRAEIRHANVADSFVPESLEDRAKAVSDKLRSMP